MQLQTVKVNILAPLEYDKNDFGKSLEDDFKVTREQAESCKATGAFDSREWFHYCFRKKPIEANFQKANSPILNDQDYQISRIEMNSVVRAEVGLSHKENVVYMLSDIKQEFRIGKVRILFTGSKAAFLHIEAITSNLTGDAALKFLNAFSQITSSRPKIQYNKKVAKDTEETITISLKTLVQNIVELQSYLPVSIYKDRINPYFQVGMIGTGETEYKECFFDSVRSMSKRISSKAISDEYVYVGKEPYISRFVGDRVACIFGDTGICGAENLPFITDIGNGLIKTATENYLTVYVFLVSLRLIIEKNNPGDADMQYLLHVPMHWSDEDNIREFFEECLWENGWKLEKEISKMEDRVSKMERKESLYEGLEIGEDEREGHSTTTNPTVVLPAYSGDDSYVFLSYSHKDPENAMDFVRRLQSDGYRVWYDGKLKPGSYFDEEIASSVKQCGCFIALLSQGYLQSEYCIDEILYAKKKNRPIIPIYLEDIQLTDDLDMHTVRLHALFKYNYCDTDSFYQELYESPELIPCRDSDR